MEQIRRAIIAHSDDNATDASEIINSATDRERQEDEITALSSIYEENEFFYTKGKQIKCTVNIFFSFPKKLKIQFTEIYEPSSIFSHDDVLIEHLPPIKLYIQLPDTYPSCKSPNFWLSITWLSPWKISYVCQKLDEIWQENKGGEILFLWLDFLWNDLLNFLDVRNSLDVSFMYAVHSAPDDYIGSRLAFLSDSRAINGALFLEPTKFLTSYDRAQHKIQFNKGSYTCPICLEEHIGLKCTELKNCGHVCCLSCMQEHIRIRLNENIKLMCPTLDCNYAINANDVKILCPSLFARYEDLMLRLALDTMNDVVYCPRISCQYPVIRDTDEIAIICPNCSYCFCIYCRKVYHGVMPCKMASDDVNKLIDDYKSSDPGKQKLLEKRYGRRQIQLIEKHLTTEYLRENAKSCPSCRSLISKTNGCNLMTCSHCHSYFCWLCGDKIAWRNEYEHFTRGDSQCFGCLFKGTEPSDFDYDIVQNIIQFGPNLYLD